MGHSGGHGEVNVSEEQRGEGGGGLLEGRQAGEGRDVHANEGQTLFAAHST